MPPALALRLPEPETLDPVWAAVLAAPLDNAPETDEESAAFDELLADLKTGRRGVGPEEIRATIERMRHEQGG